MNKNVIKRAIIIISILIVLIIIVLLALLLSRNKEEEQILNEASSSGDVEQEEVTFEEKIDKYDFLVVSNCVYDYMDKLNKNSSSYYGYDANGNYTITLSQDIIRQNIYDLLSDNYTQKNSITLDNIYDYVEDVNEHLMFVPVDMLVQKGEQVNTYAVYGYTINSEYNLVEYIYTLVNIDTQNQTYSIEPIDEEYYKTGVLENTVTSIEKNDNNELDSLQLTEIYRLQQYFQNYKFMLLSNPDLAYEFLNEEYKQKSFGNVDNFKEYVNSNRENILTMSLSEYDSNTVDNYTEFIEKDTKDKYYIFNISNSDATDYNVMLDTYVVGSAELQNTYNNSNDQRKVNINTMKFIYAINYKNYYYAYNVLADSFKNNNFATQEEFENYVQNNLFENITIEDATFSESGGYYVYDLTISNDSGETKKMTVIMELLEGTDFVMSFSVE